MAGASYQPAILTGGATVTWKPRSLDESFEIATDNTDQSGNSPCRVKVGTATNIVGQDEKGRIISDRYKVDEVVPLTVLSPGVQRIRLYCSEEIYPSVSIILDEGTSKLIGRRSETITETLKFSNSYSQKLKHSYGSPIPKIEQVTHFFDATGNKIDPPIYYLDTCEFYSPVAVYGAIVVRYDVAFSLYEINYDCGRGILPADRFKELQDAWLTGDVTKASVPPVRVIALSEAFGKIAEGEIERKIDPQGDPMLQWRGKAYSGNYVENTQLRKITTRTVGVAQVADTIALTAIDPDTGGVFKLVLGNL
ncbi:MAG: hypothetical protein HQL73_02735 [Magnetococcales bacterium]|nr:hypothetical protein [Magnetococcales bacterium]